MNYTEIFHEVVSIMEKDSATCKDMGAGDFQKYREQIKNDMSEKAFTLIVKKYIASFGLEGHLSFWNNHMKALDFSVMRYEDSLYVISASEHSVMKFKDKIIEVDGQTIEMCASLNKEFLMGETNERQGFLWNQILLFADCVTVERDGKCLEIPLERADGGTSEERYSFRDMGNNTLLMKLLDFDDEAAIRNLYEECRELMDNCKNLIIDVRNNGGGSDTAFMPLFEYCYPKEKKIKEFMPKEQPVAINYTERNCETRLKMIDEFFTEGVSDDVLPFIEQMKAQLVQNKGKGLIVDESENEEDGIDICGRTLPETVWIITNERCASSGEAFVKNMSYSPKVRIVGRPTLGILDYSNCSVAVWDQFQMVYPTSRDGSIDSGEGMGHKGVPVDHYIPWTPVHLEKDVDMEYVLEQISTTRGN